MKGDNLLEYAMCAVPENNLQALTAPFPAPKVAALPAFSRFQGEFVRTC